MNTDTACAFEGISSVGRYKAYGNPFATSKPKKKHGVLLAYLIPVAGAHPHRRLPKNLNFGIFSLSDFATFV